MPHCCRQTGHRPRDYRLKTQVTIISVVTLYAVNAGMSICQAAVMTPQIQAENGSLHIDEEDVSWIASVYSIASPMGCLVGGVLSELFGRKPITFAGFGSMAVGWLIISLSQSKALILAGRIVEGMSKSLLATVLALVVDEVAYPTFRGFIFFHFGTMLSVGIFAMMGLATLLTWRTSSLVAFGFSAISSVSVWLLCESPTWLVRKGRLVKAETALYHVWGPSRHQKAMEVLQTLKSQHTTERKTPNLVLKSIPSCKKFMKPSVLKPFLIIHAINVFIQLFCGSHLVINYSVEIVSSMSKHHDPYIVNIILSLIRAIVCFITAGSAAFVGRRTFMMISGIGSTVSTIALAAVLYLEVDALTTDVRGMLSIVLLGLYVTFFTSGYFMVPTIMIGETLPAAVRSYLCGYIYTINDFTGGGVVKMYPWLLRTLHLHGMFLMFGISCAICALFAYLFLPETNGKTLEEIEEYFKQDNIMWLTRHRARSAGVSETRGLCDESVA